MKHCIFTGMITVVKVGGAILNNAEAMTAFLNEFAQISGKKVLVHGGGRSASEQMKRLGKKPTMVDGRRITDAETLEIITMVYAGLNKQLVAKLQAKSIHAIGLTGADLNVLKATKRPPTPIDFGFVGDIESKHVNTDVLYNIVTNGHVPVFAALTHDGNGQLLNTNADTIASVLAQALQLKEDVRLVYTFEKKGLLRDVHDDSSLIRQFSWREFESKPSFIDAGMIPKLENAFAAKQATVEEVIICNVSNLVQQKERTAIVL